MHVADAFCDAAEYRLFGSIKRLATRLLVKKFHLNTKKRGESIKNEIEFEGERAIAWFCHCCGDGKGSHCYVPPTEVTILKGD